MVKIPTTLVNVTMAGLDNNVKHVSTTYFLVLVTLVVIEVDAITIKQLIDVPVIMLIIGV